MKFLVPSMVGGRSLDFPVGWPEAVAGGVGAPQSMRARGPSGPKGPSSPRPPPGLRQSFPVPEAPRRGLAASWAASGDQISDPGPLFGHLFGPLLDPL